MRISDWSSDVCSSDLLDRIARTFPVELHLATEEIIGIDITQRHARIGQGRLRTAARITNWSRRRAGALRTDAQQPPLLDMRDSNATSSDRSEERRVGKQSDSTCISRW